MADSRFAAARQWGKRWPALRKAAWFTGMFVLALVLAKLLQPAGLSPSAANALFLLLFAAALWISEAIPPFAVSILIIGFAIYFIDSVQFTQISADWQKYLATWSSPVIWIMLGGFFLAMGAQVTGFDRSFSKHVLSYFGQKPYNILLGCMMITGVLSMFMSNTATTAMMVAILAPIVKPLDAKDPFIKAMFLGVAAAATIGGMGTVIGSPPNAIALGIIQNNGIGFSFLQWMLLGVPAAIVLILAVWLILKSTHKSQYTALDLVHGTPPANGNHRNTLTSRVIVVITFSLTIGLWLTSTVHNIPVAVVSFLPIVIFTVSGVVTAHDLRLLPWDTLILVAGGLTLGIVLSDTGLATVLVSNIPIFENTLIMLVLMGWITTLLSNIMSNTAAASILIPVGAGFMPDKALLVSLVVGLSASTALFLPISTPPNAIAFSTGFLKQKDFRRLGIIVGLAGPILVALLGILLYD